MAGYYDFQIDRGVTFKRTLGWRIAGLPVDISGFKARIEGRKNLSQIDPDFTLTSDVDGGIVMGDANGRIDIYLPPAKTVDLRAGIYFYWLDINTGSEATRLLEGRITIKEGTAFA